MIRAFARFSIRSASTSFRSRIPTAIATRGRSIATGVRIVAVVTEWTEFRSPDFEEVKRLLRFPVVFDGRNVYDTGYLDRLGIRHYAIGRAPRPVA